MAPTLGTSQARVQRLPPGAPRRRVLSHGVDDFYNSLVTLARSRSPIPGALMSRGRHSAAPATPARTFRFPTVARSPRPSAPARSLRLPVLAMVTLLGAGVVGSGPQAAGENADLAPLSVEPSADRSQDSASRSFEREPLVAEEKAEATAPAPEPAPPVAVVPAPEPVAAPAPAPLPAVTGQMWTTDAVNVRTGPAADAERLTTAAFATAVDVTGAAEGEWSQVVWEGAVAWVNSSFLAATQPEAPQVAAAGAGGTSDAACSVSSGIESALQSNARAVYRSVCAAFPQVGSYGGPRPGDSGDHGTGRAVDIMISGETGWEIARFLQANAGSLGITYVIYQQQIWMAGDPTSAWSGMEDRGGATANHYDHVHVSTS
jgi:uncharacterized protein YraI